MVSNFDMLFYTLGFIVPGFVMDMIFRIFIPKKKLDVQNSLFRFIYLSCLNYAIWSWAIFIIYKSGFIEAHKIWSAVIWAIIILFSPVIIGLLAAKQSDKGWAKKVLNPLGFNTIHPTPSAWDYKFSKINDKKWVLITLIDGSTIAGVFAYDSFASSDIDERDVYIEKIYKINDNGCWNEVERSDGILVKCNQIKTIEFWNDERVNQKNGK
jgi:hypothetical protein